MALNKRTDYGADDEQQGSKSNSLTLASKFVKEIIEEITPLVDSCIYYNSEIKLGNAPAVELPNGKKAIAPDILCLTKNGKRFWIEVKDKSQRFFHPDTGADLFQVYGWYNINKFLGEPVFVLFKDPPFDDCLPRTKVSDDRISSFKSRWINFGGSPYGSWLSNCMALTENYPRIFKERTRNEMMYIIYFSVFSLAKVTSWEAIIKQVDEGVIQNVQDSFNAFFAETNQQIDEVEVRKLLASVFRL